ncbi:type VI secretion system protein TssA [Pseudomonas sp. 3A(2025)]
MFGIETLNPSELREHLHALFQPIREQKPTGNPISHTRLDYHFESKYEGAIRNGRWDAESDAYDLLSNRTKDLMIAAKLGHLWLMHHGAAGLPLALDLLTGLCKAFSTELYPRDPDDAQSTQRLTIALSWAASTYASTLLYYTPLLGVQGSFSNPITLSNWISMHNLATGAGYQQDSVVQGQRLVVQYQAAVDVLPDSHIIESIQALRNASPSLQALASASLEHLPGEQPRLQELQNALDKLCDFYQDLLDKRPAIVEAPPATLPEITLAPDAPRNHPASREAAYQQLQSIAEYLAIIEPHSPVPYLINRGVEWGSMPLHQLLEQLAKSNIDHQDLWSGLGIFPHTPS